MREHTDIILAATFVVAESDLDGVVLRGLATAIAPRGESQNPEVVRDGDPTVQVDYRFTFHTPPRDGIDGEGWLTLTPLPVVLSLDAGAGIPTRWKLQRDGERFRLHVQICETQIEGAKITRNYETPDNWHTGVFVERAARDLAGTVRFDG